jgi:hypothetical protein
VGFANVVVGNRDAPVGGADPKMEAAGVGLGCAEMASCVGAAVVAGLVAVLLRSEGVDGKPAES